MTLGEVARTIARRFRKRVYPPCVLLIRLSGVPVRAKPNEAMIEALIRKEMGTELAQHFAKLADAGRLIVLFDGMDEMPRRYYNEYVTVLSEFGARYAGVVRTLYSCRINDFSPAFRHHQLVLMPYNRRQIREDRHERFRGGVNIDKRPHTADAVWRHVTAEDFPLEVGNPLILSFLTSYLAGEERWPESRSLLFERYLQRNHDKIQDSDPPARGQKPVRLPFRTAMDYWSRLALLVTRRDSGASIDLSGVSGWETEEAHAAIEEGTLCGLLVADEPESDAGGFAPVGFSHHRLQEYLTAYLAHDPRGQPPRCSTNRAGSKPP